MLSFIYVPRQCVLHFKSDGGIVLLSFIYYQRQCVIHTKSEGHWWAWGDCVVVSEFFSTSLCHSFQKRGSPLGFPVSACLQRLFGWSRCFRLNFSLIINLFNFFNSSHMFQFSSAWGLNQERYVCECSMHTPDPLGAMALQMPLLSHSCVCKRHLLHPCTLYTWDARTPSCVRKLHVLRVDCFSSEYAKTPFCVCERPFLRR